MSKPTLAVVNSTTDYEVTIADPSTLIDRDMIAAAEQRVGHLLRRLAETRSDVDTALVSIRAAEANKRTAAIEGGSALTAAAKVLDDAKAHLAVLQDAETDLQNALLRAQQIELPAAKRKAHRALTEYAFAERLAAARDFDNAKAAMAAAEERARRASAHMGHGLPVTEAWVAELVGPVREHRIHPEITLRWCRTEIEEQGAQDTLRATMGA
jgi:hypothetical protein